ncbi:uncharacterized protein EV420DRAFT_1475132 [Desarmillaria tabescens]|uniref:Uncharacterized protein n=1 Tax=Armillaria tabescens TaxID=1929756 RepID=A0AA39NIS8_ARMTA|nr:uncharacterized protein EV420DRAFT_1475132 [Desarmillaria tabescens]KAK0466419.1 hypothetical protein EV420DRAFT_1475132 [Desarmillaria tabescens]
MAFYRAAAQPYEEQQSQGSTEPPPPDALKAFYQDMERKEMERRASRRNTSTGTSIWSRKSVKRSTQPSSQPRQPQASSQSPVSEKEISSRNEDEREMEKLEQGEQPDNLPALANTRSIIPDPLKDLPAWYLKDELASNSVALYKMRFNIHNPVGPRRYYNHHLIPPSQKSASRPPSIFSPSFPPMATSSVPEQSEESMRMPGPSRTPSNSPLPTPSSSQVRVGDIGGKPRSRKTSQTAHDNVDLLDVTDPWGTNWHHESPYDVGLNNGSVSVEAQEGRTRHTSLTNRDNRRRTVTPSPLSQSTSAVHLQPPDAGGAHLPRKLSKRRAPTFGGFFGHSDSKKDRNAISLPSTPLDEPPSARSSIVYPPPTPKRMSTVPAAPPSAFKPASLASKKDRRGSALGRLVKRFSVLKRPTTANSLDSSWHHVEAEEKAEKRSSMVVARQPSPEKVPKRVPPPSAEPVIPPPSVDVPKERPKEDRESVDSIDPPYSTMGKLTVANPDAPSSGSTTPHQRTISLPPERRDPSSSDPSLQPKQVSRPAQVPTAQATISPTTQALSSQAVQGSSSLAVPGSSSSPIQGSSSPVPASSMQVFSESMQPEVRSFDKPSEKLQTPTPIPVASSSRARRSSADVKRSPTSAPEVSAPTALASHSRRRSNDAKPKANGFPVTQPTTSGAPSSDTRRTSRSPEKKPVPPVLPQSHQIPQTSMHIYPAMISTYPHEFDNSPMSASSILVNPPTPHTHSHLHMASPAPSSIPPSLPPKPSAEAKHRESSPSVNSVTSKQTETFKLVRSMSGNVYSSSETIRAAGQQWEVVEDVKGKGKDTSRPKSKSRDRENSREKDKSDSEREHRKHGHGQKSSRRSADVPRASTSNALPRVSSLDRNRRAPIPDFKKEKEAEPQKRRESRGRKSSEVALNLNKPQPAPPPPTPGPAVPRKLERNQSNSARPTSEVPPTADLNAMKSKEAWEMERLFKARSMYGLEREASSSAPAPAPAPTSNGNDVNGKSHGSSHTSYTVQNAFQNHHQPPHSHIYHSMPTSPPAIVYSSGSQTQSLPQNLNHINTSPSFNQSPYTDFLPPSRPNPLPEPPRESPYRPAPLDALLDSTAASEYWTKYAGVTTAH